MGILEKIGLSQKKQKGAPNIGDKKKKELEKAAVKKRSYARAAIFISFLLIVIIALPQTSFQPVANYEIGEPWRSDDLTAPFTFSLQKTEAELETEREEIRQSTPPIFHVDNNADVRIQSRIDSLYRNIQPVLDSYLQWQRSKRNPDISSTDDSLRFIEERNLSNIRFSESSWNTVLENYADIQFNQRSESRFILNDIRIQINGIVEQLLETGVIDQPKNEINQNEITIRNLQERTERTVNLSNVLDLQEAIQFASDRFSRLYIPSTASVASQVFDQIIVPNWYFNEMDTNSRLQEKISEISPTKGAVAQGQVIIRRGDIVTTEKANMLESLTIARASTATEFERWLRYSGEIIVLIMASFVFFMYLFLYRRSIYENVSMFLLVFLSMSIIAIGSAVAYPFDEVNSYIVPVAIAPIILTIIFDSRVGLLATFTLAIITALYHDYNFQYLVATTTACSLGVFSVRDIKNRSQFFFTTPGIVFITYVIIIGGFALARFSGWEKFLNDTFFVLINSFFILFTYPLILLFEKMFKVTTDFTLIELSDTNHKLLKDLMNKAPGTFHHSLQVANLAETAASAIGANALLCRVAAMYHDIGKMEKPGYFVENQTGINDHDKIKPQMSALVIKAHVSDGVKMAEKHNLPKVIIDFIKTHHGTSLIKFFYDKAKKKEKTDREPQEEDFRYDGPLPFTKEQGIMLLADGIEAASRSMKDPTYSKLESLIDRMVDNNISDNQLNDCPLTFQQIKIIKNSFLNILVGVYHKRVEYPEDKKREEEKSKEEVKVQSNDGQENTKESVDGQ
ncbi:MAG: HD family phosphohydrolase [Balneolaceae bacterium]